MAVTIKHKNEMLCTKSFILVNTRLRFEFGIILCACTKLATLSNNFTRYLCSQRKAFSCVRASNYASGSGDRRLQG